MKYWKYFVFGLSIIVTLSFLTVHSFTVNARSDFFSNSTTNRRLFAVPEGGYSSIYVEVKYMEKYTTSGNLHTFAERSKIVSYLRGFATSCPNVFLDNVSHSNGKLFKSWTQNQVIFDPTKWDGCEWYTNYDSTSYSIITDITGKLPFRLECDGGIPSSVAHSVTLSLK